MVMMHNVAIEPVRPVRIGNFEHLARGRKLIKVAIHGCNAYVRVLPLHHLVQFIRRGMNRICPERVQYYFPLPGIDHAFSSSFNISNNS